MAQYYRKSAVTAIVFSFVSAMALPCLAAAAPLHGANRNFAPHRGELPAARSKAANRPSASAPKGKARQAAPQKPHSVKQRHGSFGQMRREQTVWGQARSAAPPPVQKPRPFEKAIHGLSLKYRVPEDLIHAVVNTESQYNYRLRGGVGEIGLMQIRPATARLLGYTGSVKELYNPAVNLEYGTRYLALAQYLSGGSLCGTVLKYNAGHGATRMNPISFRYCQKVKAYLYAVGYR